MNLLSQKYAAVYEDLIIHKKVVILFLIITPGKSLCQNLKSGLTWRILFCSLCVCARALCLCVLISGHLLLLIVLLHSGRIKQLSLTTHTCCYHPTVFLPSASVFSMCNGNTTSHLEEAVCVCVCVCVRERERERKGVSTDICKYLKFGNKDLNYI